MGSVVASVGIVGVVVTVVGAVAAAVVGGVVLCVVGMVVAAVVVGWVVGTVVLAVVLLPERLRQPVSRMLQKSKDKRTRFFVFIESLPKECFRFSISTIPGNIPQKIICFG